MGFLGKVQSGGGRPNRHCNGGGLILSAVGGRRRGVADTPLLPGAGSERAEAVLGMSLTRPDWRAMLSAGAKCYLLRPCDVHRQTLADGLRKYLEHGRALGIDQRYKCRTRSPWFQVPLVRVPHAFLTYMSYRIPRLVVNTAGVSGTNRVHHLTMIDKADSSTLSRFAFAFLNHLTLAAVETAGRPYGGGVLNWNQATVPM